MICKYFLSVCGLPFQSVCVCVWLCQLFCDPTDCSLPGDLCPWMFQARILEWVASSSSRVSSRPKDQICVSYVLTGRFFTTSTTWKVLLIFYILIFWPWGMWDLSSSSRDQMHTPCTGGWSHNHWTSREVSTIVCFILYRHTTQDMNHAPSHHSTKNWTSSFSRKSKRSSKPGLMFSCVQSQNTCFNAVLPNLLSRGSVKKNGNIWIVHWSQQKKLLEWGNELRFISTPKGCCDQYLATVVTHSGELWTVEMFLSKRVKVSVLHLKCSSVESRQEAIKYVRSFPRSV